MILAMLFLEQPGTGVGLSFMGNGIKLSNYRAPMGTLGFS
jgi:hypothetical protein